MDNLKFCKHSNGYGWCFYYEEYCLESPCSHEEIVEHSTVKHGRWEESESSFLVCSECADVFILEEWLADGKWNYCPNCGAKMDKEEDK